MKLTKCEYCGKKFKRLRWHIGYCKVKKTQEQAWTPTPPNYEELYKAKCISADQNNRELAEARNRANKTERALRACKEALCTIGISIGRVMEIDL